MEALTVKGLEALTVHVVPRKELPPECAAHAPLLSSRAQPRWCAALPPPPSGSLQPSVQK
eukprot:4590635-Pyramimonas_sp.AAC.1